MASNTDTDTESYISYPSEGTKSSYTSTSISLDTSIDSKDDNESYETNIVAIVKKPHPSSSYDKPSPNDCLKEISKSLRGGITFYPKDVNFDPAQDYKETVCQIEELGIKDVLVYISSCLLVTLNIDPEDVKIPKDLLCDIFIVSTEFQPLIISRASPDNNQKRKYIARLASYINGQLRTITKERITCVVFEVGLKENISRKMIMSEMPKKSRFSLSTSMTNGKYKAAVEGFFSLIISCKTHRFIKHQDQLQVLSKEEFDVLTCALDGRKADDRFETTSDTLLLKTEIASRLSRKEKTLLELPQHHHRLLDESALRKEYPLLTVTQPQSEKQMRKYRNVVTGNVVGWEQDHKEDAPSERHSASIQPDDDLQTDTSMTDMKTICTSVNDWFGIAGDSCRSRTSEQSEKKHGLHGTNRPQSFHEITARRSIEPTNPLQLSLTGSRIPDNNTSRPFRSEGILRKHPSDDFKDVGSLQTAVSRTDVKERRHAERFSSDESTKTQPDHEKKSFPGVVVVEKYIRHGGLDRTELTPKDRSMFYAPPDPLVHNTPKQSQKVCVVGGREVLNPTVHMKTKPMTFMSQANEGSTKREPSFSKAEISKKMYERLEGHLGERHPAHAVLQDGVVLRFRQVSKRPSSLHVLQNPSYRSSMESIQKSASEGTTTNKRQYKYKDIKTEFFVSPERRGSATYVNSGVSLDVSQTKNRSLKKDPPPAQLPIRETTV